MPGLWDILYPQNMLSTGGIAVEGIATIICCKTFDFLLFQIDLFNKQETMAF